MANHKMGMQLVVMVAAVAMLWGGAAAQSSSSSSSACQSALMSLSPCLNYITGNSSEPSSSCCSQLGTVVQSEPQCLCVALSGGGSSLGIKINQTQALALPAACNVQTQPISRCNGGSSSTTPSPSGTTKSPSTGGTGSKNVPSSTTDSGTDSGTSDASSTRITISMLFTLLFVASYASISVIG